MLEPLPKHPTWALRKETHSLYHPVVANGVVDRQAWARVVRETWDAEIEIQKWGAKTRLASKIGVNVRTVDTWLAAAVDVKEASVRALAEAYELDVMGLLIEVGYYTREQMPVRLTEEQIDEEQRYVLDRDDLNDEAKADILQQLDAMRSTDDAWIKEQQERNRARRQAEIDHLIQRARRDA